MKPFLYEKLLAGLLLELCNESYEMNRRFLSRRRICQLWSVSTPTAESALRALAEMDILESRPRSGFRLRHGFRRRALYILNKWEMGATLSPRTSWAIKRHHLVEKSVELSQRIAIIFDGYEYQRMLKVSRPDFLESCSLLCAQGCLEAAGEGYQVQFFALSPKDNLLKSLQADLKKGRVSGAILFQRNVREKGMQPLIKSITSQGIPAVCVFASAEKTSAIAIDINNIHVGYTAGQVLVRQGHKRIAGCVPAVGNRRAFDRLRGVQMAVQDHGKDGVRFLSLKADKSGGFSKSAEAMLLDPSTRPDALYFPGHCDFEAMEPFLTRHRIRIPEDISIIMTSSLPEATGLKREVDVMKIDFFDIGYQAVSLMRKILTNTPALPKMTLVNLNYCPNGSVKQRL